MNTLNNSRTYLHLGVKWSQVSNNIDLLLSFWICEMETWGWEFAVEYDGALYYHRETTSVHSSFLQEIRYMFSEKSEEFTAGEWRSFLDLKENNFLAIFFLFEKRCYAVHFTIKNFTPSLNLSLECKSKQEFPDHYIFPILSIFIWNI